MSTPRTTDARNRALRTFVQGLATDVLAAVVLLLLPIVTAAEGWGDFEWNIIGFLLAKTVVVTGLSYVMRQHLDPSAVPSPLPPADPGDATAGRRVRGKA